MLMCALLYDSIQMSSWSLRSLARCNFKRVFGSAMLTKSRHVIAIVVYVSDNSGSMLSKMHNHHDVCRSSVLHTSQWKLSIYHIIGCPNP